MFPKRALLIIAACFGLGLGLARSIPTAHACSCAFGDIWELELAEIVGLADPAAEQAFWLTRGQLATLDVDELQLILDTTGHFTLEPVQ